MLAVVTVVESQVTVHIKAWKQGKVYAETIIDNPERIRLRCRECNRWHTMRVIRGAPQLVEVAAPA